MDGMANKTPSVGLVLTGGGARGAYQAGVLKAVCEITDTMGVAQPFPILSGVSAGAVNAGFLAAYADDMRVAIQQLCFMWGSVRTSMIFRVDAWSLLKIAFKGVAELLFGGAIAAKRSRSLLDTRPLQDFTRRSVPYSRIQKNIDNGHLHALAVTAVSYSDGASHTFFQGHPDIQTWKRLLRKSSRTVIGAEHILASGAIPLLFMPIQLRGGYYGDGSLRNTTPLSPAIKMGAERLLVIGTRQTRNVGMSNDNYQASPARVISVLLNSVLLDAIDFDYERLTRVNATLSQLPKGASTELRPIKVCIIRPSADIGAIASEQADQMPRLLSHLVGGLGSRQESADLISYLLFEPAFTHWLMDLGYRDGMAQKDEIREFYS